MTPAARRWRPRVGLVLAGGGGVGAAYHAGVLAALQVDLGWDPRDAEIIVGTSAGSIVASMLRLGVPADDVAAMFVEAPAREAHRTIVDAARQPSPFPDRWWDGLMRPERMRLPHPRALVAATTRLVRRGDPLGFLTALSPAGAIDLRGLVEAFDEHAPTWPEGLWTVAVEVPSLRRVVFGRDRSAPLAAAVAASCSIPAVTRPVEIDGRRYVDGGAHSASNADVLLSAASRLDVVVVSSPLTGATGRRHPMRPVHVWANRQLARELQALRDAGLHTVTIEPSAHLRRVMGTDLLARDRTTEIVREAFLEAGHLLHERGTRTVLAGLAGEGAI